MVVNMFIDI